MDEDWRNAFGILMCAEICDGAGAGICECAPSTCSSIIISFFLFIILTSCICLRPGRFNYYGNFIVSRCKRVTCFFFLFFFFFVFLCVCVCVCVWGGGGYRKGVKFRFDVVFIGL